LGGPSGPAISIAGRTEEENASAQLSGVGLVSPSQVTDRSPKWTSWRTLTAAAKGSPSRSRSCSWVILTPFASAWTVTDQRGLTLVPESVVGASVPLLFLIVLPQLTRS